MEIVNGGAGQPAASTKPAHASLALLVIKYLIRRPWSIHISMLATEDVITGIVTTCTAATPEVRYTYTVQLSDSYKHIPSRSHKSPS